jgi:hypothetical protein
VRAQLARWAPPEPAFSVIDGSGQSARRNPATQWWREIPAWAQVAAALLFLGVSAGIANLDVRYDANGLNVRTGWMPRAGAGRWQPDGGGRRCRRCRRLRGVPTSRRSSASSRTNSHDADVVTVADDSGIATDDPLDDAGCRRLRRVRAIVDESEKRQQRELALRVAEVMRDVTAQRRTDLVNIDRMLGFVQDKVGVEVMKDRQRLDLLYRASQRQ